MPATSRSPPYFQCGQSVMKSPRSSSATPSSDSVRPLTEMPAATTVSGVPETSGCHQARPLPSAQAAVGTALRKPGKLRYIDGIELEAVGNQAMAVGIVGATAGFAVEQVAYHGGRVDLGGVLVLELDQAAAAAPVAQAFPFGPGHLDEALSFPELVFGHGDKHLMAGDGFSIVPSSVIRLGRPEKGRNRPLIRARLPGTRR